MAAVTNLLWLNPDSIPENIAPGDTVTFSTSTNCVMDGDDSNSCPPANGGASTFTTAYMVAGANYVALGLNSSLFL